jgi:hypothetical protein
MARNPFREALRARADRNVGLLAEFANPGDLYAAVKAVRKAGYARIDTFSPFPIHGMDKAMGLGPSRLGYLVIVGGLSGVAAAFLMQWWMGAFDYPLNIGGKPSFAWEASVPVAFEITVLFAALTAVAGMLALNGLPQPYNPLFYSERFGRATDDGFFLQISAADRRFDRGNTAGLLRDLGAIHVEYVDHTGAYSVAENGALIQVGPRPMLPAERATRRTADVHQ